jgi:saccharopine dehydrogenase-like NADP-dependent oxidoreductase
MLAPMATTARTILALGGAGFVGRHAIATLRVLEPDASIVIVDRDGEAAARAAEEHGVRGVALDVTDEAALAAALSEADVVMNTVGPYFRFGVPILRAAIAAGCHYVDVCDDWEPTVEMLKLDERARAAGVTAVIGMGISPGVSNLLARLAVEELDVAREVFTGWLLEGARPEVIGPEPSAATVHGIEQLTGTIRVWRDGRFVEEKPVRKTAVHYPGLSPAYGFTIGHPEPITLPRRFPALERSLNLMVTDGVTALALRSLGRFVDAGWLSKRTLARWAERLEGAGGEDMDAEQVIGAIDRGELPLPPIFASASGERDGAEAAVGATITATPPGGMGGATGIPLGVGVSLLLNGLVETRGVCAPEAAVDPRAFFDRLARHCRPARPGMDELVLLTRSWERRTLAKAWRDTVG